MVRGAWGSPLLLPGLGTPSPPHLAGVLHGLGGPATRGWSWDAA